MVAENRNIQRGDTIAIWGCGPEVGVSEVLQDLTGGADPMPALMWWGWKRMATASMPSMTGQR